MAGEEGDPRCYGTRASASWLLSVCTGIVGLGLGDWLHGLRTDALDAAGLLACAVGIVLMILLRHLPMHYGATAVGRGAGGAMWQRVTQQQQLGDGTERRDRPQPLPMAVATPV